MRKPNPNVGRQIAFRLRMKKAWSDNREGMIKRSKAGAKAKKVKAAHRREWWVNLFAGKARHLTKQEIINSIISNLAEGVESKPRSVMTRLMRYGIIRFDEASMNYINVFSDHA